jgi:hypothetical protein
MKKTLEGEGFDTFEPALTITKEAIRNATPEQLAQWEQIVGAGVLERIASEPDEPRGVKTITAITPTVMRVASIEETYTDEALELFKTKGAKWSLADLERECERRGIQWRKQAIG